MSASLSSDDFGLCDLDLSQMANGTFQVDPTQDAPPSPPKISQRPSKSCTECIRRKTRCDKKIPCDCCLKRGVPHRCRLESQYAPVIPAVAQPSSAPLSLEVEALRRSVFTELESLRKRVFELEQRSTTIVTGQDFPGASTMGSGSLQRQKHGDKEVEDAATTLEFFALGVDRRRGASEDRTGSRAVSVDSSLAPQPQSIQSHILADSSERSIPESISDALLLRPTVHAILEFAEEHVQWQHCCVFFPDFWKEVEMFWNVMDGKEDGWTRVEPTWIALFYTLQGIAVHQMTDADANACGLTEADRYVLPNALISAAEEAFYHGQFLSRHTMWTVQAIAILVVCGHNVCESELLSTLLAIGIKTAQALNLHSLGKISTELGAHAGHSHAPKRKKMVEVETGKRIWWSLVQQDWFVIPFRGVWSVHPDHFDTPPPSNCHDTDLLDGHFKNRPNSVLTIAFKQRFSSHIAQILQSFFHRMKGSNVSAFALAVECEKEIRNHIQTLPDALRADHPSILNSYQPKWAQMMRLYLHISATHKILVVYRAFLAHGGSDRERAKAQQSCIIAAESIIQELEEGSKQTENSQALWTLPYHCLAAAVVLSLDMFVCAGKPEAEKRRHSVLQAKASLERLAPTSRIARRGLQVLVDLLKEDEEASRKKKRRNPEAMTRIVKKIKLPANEMLVDETQLPTQTASATSSSQSPIMFLPGVSPEWPAYHFEFSQDETNQLLASLQSTAPDVSRLFDGSIGSFGWTG